MFVSRLRAVSFNYDTGYHLIQSITQNLGQPLENAMADKRSEDRMTTAAAIARSFVTARQNGQSLAGFPGRIPLDLDSAYLCQESAIKAWPDRLIGWKVGMIAPPLRTIFGCDRLAGAIFEAAVRGGAGEIEFPVFVGGFAAVEAEFVLRIARDAPAGKVDWSAGEARALVGAMHIGIETAGSPLATINELGPTVIAADFGNNAGLILGPEVPDWSGRTLESLGVMTRIDGAIVGRGDAGLLPQGPIGALQFLAGQAAKLGRPLQGGMLVSTGAVTGVHDIQVGQSGVADFGALGRISCRAVAAAKK
jgi:2-keto-4-pentenoate hydratase